VSGPSVLLLSLEPWDQVWRRNQHFSAELLRQGLARRIVFVNPPAWAAAAPHEPVPGIRVVTPRRRLPNRLGGIRQVAAELASTALRDIDVLWINDPVLGAALPRRRSAVYDVTDDWRTAPAPPRILRRIVAAEDRLARTATTVVCSHVLRDRWRERYGVEAAVVHNGVDGQTWSRVRPRPLPGPGPHVGYVGTLHQERLDLDLVCELAADPRIGTLHLVGPDAMDVASRRRLEAAPGLRLHGPVPAHDVPSWTVSFDVLVSPHRVSDFTLSLDAIKSYEYLASGRPVVATPTSGFQHLRARRLRLARADGFADAVHEATTDVPTGEDTPAPTWAERATQFGAVLEAAWRRR
jgi:glycosyltransferase involved in cell wall biosynthesis